MSLLRNLNTRLGRIGIDPNISIPPKLTPSLPRGPVIRLPKKPPSIGRLPSIAEPMPIVRKLPVGEPIPFVPPIIQPEPMPVEPISPIAAPMPIRLPIDMPMPVAEPMPISMADPIEVPVAQPMPMPIQQPIATQPLERMDMPINKKRDFMSIERIPTPPKRQDFMSIGGPGGGFGLDERDAIDSGVPSAPSPGIGLGAVDDLGVPIFGNRDTPGANSTAFERKNDPESLRLQGGPKYTTMPVGPGVPFDPSGLQARISDLEGRQMFDPSGLKSRIDALENRQMPTFTPFDPSGLQSRLDALENRQMPSYTPFDPSSLQSQIDALQNRQTPMFNPSGLQARLNTLEDRIQKTGNLNMTDIEALIEQRLSDSLRNMNLSPRNPGVNSITYDPNVSIPFKEEDLRKRYNNRLFIGQGGPYDI
jgi:hypothetical protein